jgi:hypothetical protein
VRCVAPCCFALTDSVPICKRFATRFASRSPRVSRDVRACALGWHSYAQVVKQYGGCAVVGVVQRICQGTPAQVAALLQASQGGGGINTAYIERLTLPFAHGWLRWCGGAAACAPNPDPARGRLLVGTVYNFCTYHESLRVELLLPHHRRRWLRRTPAIATGITDHLWSVSELLWFKVPKSRSYPNAVDDPARPFWTSKNSGSADHDSLWWYHQKRIAY